MFAGLNCRQVPFGKIIEHWPPPEKPVNGMFEVFYTYCGDPKTYSVFITAESREKAHDRFYEINKTGYVVLKGE